MDKSFYSPIWFQIFPFLSHKPGNQFSEEDTMYKSAAYLSSHTMEL